MSKPQQSRDLSFYMDQPVKQNGKKQLSLSLFVLILLFFLSLFITTTQGKRPELVKSSVWFTNTTLLNLNFDASVVQLVIFFLFLLLLLLLLKPVNALFIWFFH